MIIRTHGAETNHALRVAEGMISAAKTAPKAKGLDRIKSAILTGADLYHLADQMDLIAKEYDMPFFSRDANCIRQSTAVVLLGVRNSPTGLNEVCTWCGEDNCQCAFENQTNCVFCSIDLGIAAGCAVAYATDMRVDTRILFSGGRAAQDMNIFPKRMDAILAIPLSISAKSPFFDRG